MFRLYIKTSESDNKRRQKADMIFVTSSTSSASVKYFWVWVKSYRINTLTTLSEGKGVKIITQDELNFKEYYTRG